MVLLETRVGVKYVVADEIQIILCCCGSNTNMLHLKMSNTLSFKNSNTNTLDQIKICYIKLSNKQGLTQICYIRRTKYATQPVKYRYSIILIL